MNDPERLDAAFRSALMLPGSTELATVSYASTPEWDSVGHLQLMAGLDEAFKISIRDEDVVEMSDYASVRRILRERYGASL
ncbi:MAG: acyl carrier protein [Actinobacteria bacterium]|nr:MAG: acyl carrier protein [Actinomycetota bacterium]